MAEDYAGSEVVSNDPYEGSVAVAEPKASVKSTEGSQQKAYIDLSKPDAESIFNSLDVGKPFLLQDKEGNVSRKIKTSATDIGEDTSAIPVDNGPPEFGEGVLAKAGLSAPASAAFLTTMGASSRALQGLQGAGPVGKTVATIGPLVMGAGAAALESILQRKVTEAVAPGVNRYEESLTPEQNAIGGALGSGFRPGGFSGTITQQAKERLIPAALGAGMQGGVELANGMQEGAGGRILESAATNALLNKATAPAEALMGLGAGVAQRGMPSLVAKIDGLGKTNNLNVKTSQINSEIALGGEPENLAGLGPGLRTEQRRPLADVLTPKPKDIDFDGFKASIEERGNKIVEAITKFADKQSYREANADLLNQLKTIGLNAEESASVFEAAEAAKTHFTNYAGAEVPKASVTLGELIGKDVEYAGYKGKLIREPDGGFSLVPKGVGKIVEIADTGKDFDVKAKDVKVNPIETSNDFRSENRKNLENIGVPKKDVAKLNDMEVASRLKTEMDRPDIKGVSSAGDAGIVANPLKNQLPQVDRLLYKKNPNGTYDVSGGKEAKITPKDVEITPKFTGKGLKYEDLVSQFGKTAADHVVAGHGQRGIGNTRIIDVGEFDYVSKFSPHAFINPTVAKNLAAPVLGAGIGYQFGDTEEEKRRNAVLGALIASGGVFSKTLAQTLAKTNKPLIDQINRLAVESRAKGQSVLNDYITGMKDSPVSDAASLGTNLGTPALHLPEVQDAPSGDTANPSPRYQWTPWLSKTAFGKAVKKLIGTVEGNIFPISPRVGGAIREYGGLIDQLKVEWTEGTYELGKAVRKSLTPEEVKAFDYELQFGSHAKAREMLASKNEELAALLDKAKDTYENMAMAEESVGREVNRIEDAWPRQMLDYDAFRKDMGRDELGALDKAIEAAEKAKKRPLSEHEKSDILNDAIALTLKGKPSFLKARTVHGLTQDQFLRNYEPFDVAMDNRIAKASRDVARRKFVGYDSPENTDLWNGRTGGFGEILEQERGNLSPEAHKVVMENLKDLLRQDSAAGNAIAELGNKISRAQNILFLGDISTSVAQFGDLFVNMRRYGPQSAIKGLMDRKIKLGDLGLGGDTFAETQNLSRGEQNQGAGGKARRTRDAIIKLMVGWADKVNKESTVNAARIEYSKVLRDPTSSEYVNLYKKYQERFPERWPDMIKDLKSKDFENGTLTDNTRFFLMNELADIQPISMAQRAQLENASPSARFLYSLKRYWIKQLDILRQEGYEKFKNPETRGQGVKNVATYLAIVSAMQGLAIATIRDIMFGRDVDLNENALGGVFQTFGVNRYMFENVRQGHLGDAAINFVSPMASVATDAYRDYGTLVNKPLDEFPENSRMAKYLPVIGREAYYLGGAGVAAKEKAEKKSQKSIADGELTPSLGALEKLFLPPPAKKKR